MLFGCLVFVACSSMAKPPPSNADMPLGGADMRPPQAGPDMAACVPGADGLHRDLSCDPGCPTLGSNLAPEGGSACSQEGLECVYISWTYTCKSGMWAYAVRQFPDMAQPRD